MVSPEVGVAYGFAIASALIALAYMLGYALGSERFKAYAKLEVGELVFSAIIVAIVITALLSSGNILGAMTKGEIRVPADVQQRIENNMEKPLESTIKVLAKNAMRFAKVASYNYNMQGPSIVPLSPTTSNSPGSGAHPLSSQFVTGIDTTSITLMLSKTLRLGYRFLEFAFAQSILAIGLFLRILPPTKKVGGLLLGVGLSVAFVFPVSVAWTTDMASEFAPSLATYQNDGLLVSSGDGLLLPDQGDPPGSDLIANEAVQTMYTFNDIVGPKGVCAIGCASVCAALQAVGVLYPGCFAACWGGTGKPPFVPGSACSGVLAYAQFLAQVYFPIKSSIALEGGDLNMSADEMIDEYYNPTVNRILPVVVERNLAILVMAVLQIASTVILAKSFASALGGEGQIYGISKLI